MVAQVAVDLEVRAVAGVGDHAAGVAAHAHRLIGEEAVMVVEVEVVRAAGDLAVVGGVLAVLLAEILDDLAFHRADIASFVGGSFACRLRSRLVGHLDRMETHVAEVLPACFAHDSAEVLVVASFRQKSARDGRIGLLLGVEAAVAEHVELVELAALFQHAVHFREHLELEGAMRHGAVGDDDVDRPIGDARRGEVLDGSVHEMNVRLRESERVCDLLFRLVGLLHAARAALDGDDLAGLPRKLRGDEGVAAVAGAEHHHGAAVEHRRERVARKHLVLAHVLGQKRERLGGLGGRLKALNGDDVGKLFLRVVVADRLHDLVHFLLLTSANMRKAAAESSSPLRP